MSTRRTFLKMNLAVVGASVLNPIATSNAETQTRSVDLFVFDATIPEAKSLARQASGLTALPAGRDLYPIWQETLRDALMASPKTVAGITSGEAAFCLAEVAKDYGYCMVQSEVLKPRSTFNPTEVQARTLTPIELNSPMTVGWVMSRTAVTYHKADALV